MKDKTVNERMHRQRALRITAGWKEVRVWVPTEQDAADVRKLAEERRNLVPSPSRRGNQAWMQQVADLSKDSK